MRRSDTPRCSTRGTTLSALPATARAHAPGPGPASRAGDRGRAQATVPARRRPGAAHQNRRRRAGHRDPRALPPSAGALRRRAAGRGRTPVGYLLKQRLADAERFLSALDENGTGGTVIDVDVVAVMIGRLRAGALDTDAPFLLVAHGRKIRRSRLS
jgi:hypothetical protein